MHNISLRNLHADTTLDRTRKESNQRVRKNRKNINPNIYSCRCTSLMLFQADKYDNGINDVIQFNSVFRTHLFLNSSNNVENCLSLLFHRQSIPSSLRLRLVMMRNENAKTN